jgi:hypothetical protein
MMMTTSDHVNKSKAGGRRADNFGCFCLSLYLPEPLAWAFLLVPASFPASFYHNNRGEVAVPFASL